MSKLTPLQATAPRRIFLQIDDHEGGHDEPFPDDTEGVTWWVESAQACEVAYVREDLAAAPAGGAEPVGEVRRVHPGGRTRNIGVDVAELFPGAAVRPGDKLYAAPTAQPQPQPERMVLFDDRPQNQQLAAAKHAMRNPAPLQFEDEAAQPEALAEPIDRENDPLFVAGRLEDWAGSFAARGPLTQWLLKGAALLRRLATPAPVAPAEPESFDGAMEDVYDQCCAAIKPLVDRYDYPGSVVETLQRLVDERMDAPAQQPAELRTQLFNEHYDREPDRRDDRLWFDHGWNAAIKAQGGSQ
jgi:hypothetical protein